MEEPSYLVVIRKPKGSKPPYFQATCEMHGDFGPAADANAFAAGVDPIGPALHEHDVLHASINWDEIATDIEGG